MLKKSESFIPLAIREFERLKQLADDAVSQISEAQFFLQEREADNSVAVICKHMAGNMKSRWTDFLTTDGEKPNRNRDAEFLILDSDTYELIVDDWERAWRVLFDTLSGLQPDDLSRLVSIRGERLSVLQAIARQMTHYAYHVGQIVYLAKHHAAGNWTSLSIPVGQSATFNASPKKYVKEE